MGEGDPFKLTIQCYNFCGLRETSPACRKLLNKALYVVLLVLNVMICYNFRYKNENIFDLAEVFGAVSTFGQPFTRKSIFYLHSSLIEEIIRARDQFWQSKDFGVQLHEKVAKQSAFGLRIIKSAWAGCVLYMGFKVVFPVIFGKFELPEACWVPGGGVGFKIVVYSMEFVTYSEAILMVWVFDAFFLLICTDLIIQFELLSAAVRGIRFGEQSEDCDGQVAELRRCILHYKFLLTLHAKINKVFSSFLLCQYLLTIAGICIQFFIIMNKSSTFVQVVQALDFAIVLFTLMAMFIIPASNIEIEVRTNMAFFLQTIFQYSKVEIRRTKGGG